MTQQNITREDVLALTGRELDAAVAEQVLGQELTIGHNGPRSGVELQPKKFPGLWVPLRNYCTDANGCRRIEIHIGRLGLRARYVRQIWGLMGGNENDPDAYFRPVEVWDFLAAPLEMKCRAALLTVLQTEEKPNAD